MTFHENRLLAHETSYFCFRKLGNMSQNLSSAAVLSDTLRVNKEPHHVIHCANNIRVDQTVSMPSGQPIVI